MEYNNCSLEIAFEAESSTYRSLSRARAQQEAEYLRQLKEMEDKFKKRIDATVEARVKQAIVSMGSGVAEDHIPTSFSPVFKGRSRCRSTPLDEEEANAPHSVDSITEPVNVRLYIRQQWTTNKVVVGQARPAEEGTINGHPIPPGYAHVSIDSILDKKYNKIRIDYPTQKDRPRLIQNRALMCPGASASLSLITSCRCFVNWTSKFIQLSRCSRKTMVASKRDEDLYWFKPEPYVQSQR